MRNISGYATNMLSILFISFVLIVFQSSFRPFADSAYFSWIPSTINWLPVIVYLSLYRKPFEGILSIYIVLAAVSVLTISPTGLLWFAGLSTFIACQLIKSRLYWNGSQYFLLLCLISVFAAQITQFFVELIFLDFFAIPNLLLWIPQALLTMIPAWITYFLLKWADAITAKASLTEVAEGELL